MATIDDLPDEILFKIFSSFNIIERQRLELVNKRWKSIIRQIWRKIRNLKFTMEFDYSISYIHDKNNKANGIYFRSNDISDLEAILEILDGNLIDLMIDASSQKKVAPTNHLFELIHQNKRLKALAIVLPLDIDKQKKCLQCLPNECLRQLYLSLSDHSTIEQLDDVFKKMLLNTRELKYLYLQSVSSHMLEIISKITTLESLHFEYIDKSLKSTFPRPILNITKLTNLKSLSIYDSSEVDDEFLIELGKNSKELRCLELYFNNATMTGLSAIGVLENLHYLKLMKIENYEFLNNLINLEEFHCEFSPEINDNESHCLQRILQHLPNLKLCNFSDPELQIFLCEAGLDRLLTMEDIPDLSEREWNEIYQEDKMAAIDDLPDEMLRKIFSYLFIVERQRLQIVCKRWCLIIQRMWQSIHKLKFTLEPNPENYMSCIDVRDKSIIIDGLNFWSKFPSDLAAILKLFNGNLTKLEIEDQSNVETELSSEIFELVRQNVNLVSFAIFSDKKTLVDELLNNLPIKQLEHLSLKIFNWKNPHQCIEAVENVLRKTRNLTYLRIDQASSSTMKIIGEIGTLESLNLDGEIEISTLDNILLSDNKLSQLKSLNFCNNTIINDDFLVRLTKSHPELRNLELYYDDSVTNIGLNAIGMLENLHILRLAKIQNYEFLQNLFNLEQLSCEYDPEDKSDETLTRLQEVLHRLPNLKRCSFSNLHVHEYLRNADFGRQLETDYFERYSEWDEIFGKRRLY